MRLYLRAHPEKHILRSKAGPSSMQVIFRLPKSMESIWMIRHPEKSETELVDHCVVVDEVKFIITDFANEKLIKLTKGS